MFSDACTDSKVTGWGGLALYDITGIPKLVREVDHTAAAKREAELQQSVAQLGANKQTLTTAVSNLEANKAELNKQLTEEKQKTLQQKQHSAQLQKELTSESKLSQTYLYEKKAGDYTGWKLEGGKWIHGTNIMFSAIKSVIGDAVQYDPYTVKATLAQCQALCDRMSFEEGADKKCNNIVFLAKDAAHYDTVPSQCWLKGGYTTSSAGDAAYTTYHRTTTRLTSAESWQRNYAKLAQVTSLGQEVKTLTGQLSSKGAALSQAQNQVTSLTGEKTTLTGEVSAYKTQVGDLQTKINQVDSSLAEKQKTLKQLSGPFYWFGQNMNCPQGSHLQYVDCPKPANFSPPDKCEASNADECMPCQACQDACLANPNCTRVHVAWKGSQCNLFSAACTDASVRGHGGLALFNIGTIPKLEREVRTLTQGNVDAAKRAAQLQHNIAQLGQDKETLKTDVSNLQADYSS